MDTITLRSGVRVSGQPAAAARAVETDRRMANEERGWIAALRASGCKAAHPDDGWVDRDLDRVHLCYPQFNDGLGIGDLLALGWPGKETRFVRITETSENPLALSPGPFYFHFTEA